MGCQSDYMAPDKRERESKEAAEFICYIYRQQGQEAPQWAQVAAKDSYGQTGEKPPRDVVGALCDLLRSMDSDAREALIYGDPRSRPRRRLADWWERHVEFDAERDIAARRRQENETLKASAVAKLSPDERRALGL